MNAPFSKSQLQTKLRKMGNSTGIIIPKVILDQLGLASGSRIELRIEDGKVIAEPVRKVREGWEEAAREIGKHLLSEEERDWLDVDDPVPGDDEIPLEWLIADSEQ